MHYFGKVQILFAFLISKHSISEIVYNTKCTIRNAAKVSKVVFVFWTDYLGVVLVHHIGQVQILCAFLISKHSISEIIY